MTTKYLFFLYNELKKKNSKFFEKYLKVKCFLRIKKEKKTVDVYQAYETVIF